MLKASVIISGLVDETIKEEQRDITIYLFKTLEDLDTYTNTSPIRADNLFFTRDVLPHANTSINYLVSILERTFIKVDHVIYITEPNSNEIKSMKYLIQNRKYTNWEVVQGALTREYVRGVISGSARNDFTNIKRKAVYRVPRNTYIRDNINLSSQLEKDRFLDDDEMMQDMEVVTIPEQVPLASDTVCMSYDIVGHDCSERTLFCFIVAQYLSTHGKTMIIERDVEYHRLGDYITKSGVDCEHILIEDLYTAPSDVLDRIRKSSKSLIAVYCKRKVHFSYSFVYNLLYSNLSQILRYAVRECAYGEEPTESPYTVVFPNTMPGILEMCEHVSLDFIRYTNFVGVYMNTLQAIRVTSGEAIQSFIEDVLNKTDIPKIEIVSLTSLLLGTDSTYDIRSVLHEIHSL